MVVVDPSITAKTERLLLRPLRMDDAADIVLMRENPEVMLHTPTLPSSDLSSCQAWIQGCHDAPNNWNFAIELLPTFSFSYPSEALSNQPRVIGMMGAVRAPEIGYMLNQQYWGKGIATEALRAFMPLFWKHYSGENGAERFAYSEAHVDYSLMRSQNVLKKVGFRLLEVREKDFENPVLGWRDSHIYRMERPEGC
ncbi:GNAT domain-domain-containing protein [Clohesyomyces aquaticus]|uniref:GNAT domain-domain-containing protein n=1 Tax=Clohesyomyces aquaticus TaxID=1231657 RepID=A0A1Y1YRE3_9PLEO|nr:GNAT domain-domain-containing protein [Clohesyomyces aquaticus]